ncbi:MAG: hypothetical protein B6240_13220 [Desulfobacteraceae bacterium 4572_87]|nr:MAG: hypothetical protein B6240_13220 [Desulfobacteraceae bacterium 4572_87]
MVQLQKTVLMALGIFFILSVGDVFATQNPLKESADVVLTPADQLILDRIDQVNNRFDQVNDRFEQVNDRFDQVNNRFDQVNNRINHLDQSLSARINQVNDRIDNLWITMLGGFIGVMGFIGALVFWDRRTFMKRAKYEMRLELKEDRKKMDGILTALKKLDVHFPEVGEVLRSFGLL